MTQAPPFGAYAPTQRQNKLRAMAGKMPDTWFGKRRAMLLRRWAGVKSGQPFDVTLFDTQKVRLHPYDNNSEKRVYATPQFWDAAERDFLAEAIFKAGEQGFNFADVGANAGLYTMFALSAAKKASIPFKAFAMEPEPTVRARLEFNLKASGDADKVTVLPWAATAEKGEVTFSVDTDNRGENKIDTTGCAAGLTVPGHPIADAIANAGMSRVDAMKIDIEGFERPALEALFSGSEQALWPNILIMETYHDKGEDSALALCLSKGYSVALETKLNSVLVLEH